jgi:diadenosine tetraphosphate (Ap4A) HIT family hydrolase
MNKEDCFFCRLIAGKEPSWKVYEDENHVAFLTPFPNTPGFTVLVTREHRPSYVMNLGTRRYAELMECARNLALHLDEKLGTKRTALIAEGMGIDHAHVKLIPMHGIPDGPWKPILSNNPAYSEIYQGMLTTGDGPRMADEELEKIQRKIVSS